MSTASRLAITLLAVGALAGAVGARDGGDTAVQWFSVGLLGYYDDCFRAPASQTMVVQAGSCFTFANHSRTITAGRMRRFTVSTWDSPQGSCEGRAQSTRTMRVDSCLIDDKSRVQIKVRRSAPPPPPEVAKFTVTVFPHWSQCYRRHEVVNATTYKLDECFGFFNGSSALRYLEDGRLYVSVWGAGDRTCSGSVLKNYNFTLNRCFEVGASSRGPRFGLWVTNASHPVAPLDGTVTAKGWRTQEGCRSGVNPDVEERSLVDNSCFRLGRYIRSLWPDNTRLPYLRMVTYAEDMVTCLGTFIAHDLFRGPEECVQPADGDLWIRLSDSSVPPPTGSLSLRGWYNGTQCMNDEKAYFAYNGLSLGVCFPFKFKYCTIVADPNVTGGFLFRSHGTYGCHDPVESVVRFSGRDCFEQRWSIWVRMEGLPTATEEIADH